MSADTKTVFKLNVERKRRLHNTRFIQFGQKYKAFAKAVPSGKKIIFALQLAKKQLALSVIFR